MSLHTPISLPGVAQVLNEIGADVSGFPLPASASAQELLTLVDALALKIYPKGYWPLTWTLTAINMTCFFSVTLAMRAYLSRKRSASFWLVKLEHRPYRARCLCISSSKHASAIRPTGGPQEGLSVPEASLNNQYTGDHMRMGRFITASCVNCHLLFTSAYVVLLFFKVLESYIVRGPFASSPILDPGFLEGIMLFAIFSTAHFAAIGYIALLLPNMPPWIWNSAVTIPYVVSIAIGTISQTFIATVASKICSNRIFMHQAFAALDSDGRFNYSISAQEEYARKMLFKFAKTAYVQSLEWKKWQLVMRSLIVVGGTLLSVGYLIILILLSRRVAKELALLRKLPLSQSDHRSSIPTEKHTATTSCFMAAPSSFRSTSAPETVSVSRSSRFNLALSTRAGGPVSFNAAPIGHLSSPPVDAQQPASLCSTHVTLAYEDQGGHGPLSPALHSTNRPSLTQDPQIASLRIGEQVKDIYLRASKQEPETQPRGHEVAFPRQDGPQGRVSFGSVDARGLHQGTTTRLGSQAEPYPLNTLHGDLASNDGYVAVCRFLFNCIIDHVMVMMQCVAFASNSAYSLHVFSKDYPNDPQSASSKEGMGTMIGALCFTVLYVINALNLFAPFLLFPASQVKLATMLASLTLPTSISSDDGEGLTGPSNHKPRTGGSSRMTRQRSTKSQTKAVSSLKERCSASPLMRSASNETNGSHIVGLQNDSAVTDELVKSTKHHSGRSLAGRPARVLTLQEQDCILKSPTSSSFIVSTPSALGSESGKHETSHRYSSDNYQSSEHASVCGLVAQVAAVVQRFRPSSSSGVPEQQPKAVSDGSQFGSLQISQRVSAARSTSDSTGYKEQKFKALNKPLAVLSYSSGDKNDDISHSRLKSLAAWRRPSSRDAVSVEEGRPYSTNGISESSQTSRTPMAAQLVLDSLISSHALPIQGFYCQRSVAVESAPTLRDPECRASVEEGLARPTFKECLPSPRSVSSRSVQKQNQPQQEAEQYELGEKLSGPEWELDELRSMGQASMRRRQRPRHQSLYHAKHHHLDSSSRAKISPESDCFAGSYGVVASGAKDGAEEFNDVGTGSRSDHRTTLARDNVPAIFAQSPTSRTIRLRLRTPSPASCKGENRISTPSSLDANYSIKYLTDDDVDEHGPMDLSSDLSMVEDGDEHDAASILSGPFGNA